MSIHSIRMIWIKFCFIFHFEDTYYSIYLIRLFSIDISDIVLFK
jgi:hypothetical protein